MSHKIVDAVGQACPMPVVLAIQALKELDGAGTLEVHVDNEIAIQNLTRMAASRNLTAVAQKIDEKHFVVRMDAAGASAPAEDPAPACIPDLRQRTVVAIGSASMGQGSDELGAILMKGFLYALTQQERLPDTILFYNGGATIPVEGSVSLEDLRTLEAMGVEILTCGTCLNYHGLTDKLAVGAVTNMYDIVEKLTKAGKVIRP